MMPENGGTEYGEDKNDGVFGYEQLGEIGFYLLACKSACKSVCL